MVKRYFQRLYNMIHSRGHVEIELLDFDELSDRQGSVEGRLAFVDGSVLVFDEVFLLRNRQIAKLRYAYHYQDDAGQLIFRYDNAPHFPNLPTYPDHKHVGPRVEPTLAPDLGDVLREIDELIFGINMG